MSTPFEKTVNNYDLLYKFSTKPYKPTSSWTTTKTFTPDKKLSKPEFVQEPVLEKAEFILNPEWCR